MILSEGFSPAGSFQAFLCCHRVNKSLPAGAVQPAEDSQGSKLDAENLHRIKTMSDEALRQRISKIRGADKLLSIIKVSLVTVRWCAYETAHVLHACNQTRGCPTLQSGASSR